MTADQERNLIRSAPYFPVADVDKASAYYEAVLGFRCEYSAGSPAEFAIVSRDGFPVMLRRAVDPARVSPNAQQGGTWDVFFWVKDVEALYVELQERSAQFSYPPTVQAHYHMKEFAAIDADGYLLGFGQEWPAARPSV